MPFAKLKNIEDKPNNKFVKIDNMLSDDYQKYNDNMHKDG